MSGSGYWTGLLVTGLVICLAFFCLLFGAKIFVFVSERINAIELWNSPFWLKLKVPIIIIAVIAFLAGVIALARYQEHKEVQAAQEYAQAQGWDFSQNDTQGLQARAEVILSSLKNIYIYNIRTVETGQRSLYLFNCTYNYEEDSGRRSVSYGVACMLLSGGFSQITVSVDIVNRDWSEVMISNKVDMGQSPFAEKFLVLSKDPATAKATVSEAVQAIMLDHLKKSLDNPVRLTIGPGGVVVVTVRTAEPEELQDLIDLARRIESTE